MFEQSTIPKAPRRLWATCVGFGGQAVLVASMVVAPLVWPQVIPHVVFTTVLAPPGAPPPPPARDPGVRPQHRTAATRVFHATGITAPTAMPQHAAAIVDPPPEIGNYGVLGGIQGGSDNGVPGGLIDSVLAGIHPPVIERPPEPVRPAPAPVAPAVTRIYRRGGEVDAAVPIFRPEPVYPPLARSMRVSGVVELIGVIATDGHIKELRVKTGHPLLARAALDAVARWVYKPTLLNGSPVEVECPITVTFRLSDF